MCWLQKEMNKILQRDPAWLIIYTSNALINKDMRYALLLNKTQASRESKNVKYH